jgi:hypothetical protein
LFINDEHTCSGKLFSLKKEENTDWCYMDEPWRHCTIWNKLITKWQILYDSSYVILLG